MQTATMVNTIEEARPLIERSVDCYLNRIPEGAFRDTIRPILVTEGITLWRKMKDGHADRDS